MHVGARLVDAGTLECLSKAADSKRSLVHVNASRDWAQRVSLPLPEEFPREVAETKSKTRRAPQPSDSAFLRLSDMIPGLLPFSRATFWRKVKAGDFPVPVKLSDAVTAWRRDEVEAWLVAQSQPKLKTRSKR